MSPAFRIRVVTGPIAGRSLDVDSEIVIGRGGDGLAIADPELSRRHVVVRPGPNGVIVEDQGSTNGTFVRGDRITGPVALGHGDSLRVGKSEIAVEASQAGATKLHEAPDPGATRLSARPPAAPPTPSPSPAAAQKLPPWAPVALGALALILLVVLIAALSGGDSAKAHRLNAPISATALSSQPTRTIFGGVISGSPVDIGNASLDIVRARSLKGVGRSPVAITGKLVIRSDDGAANGTFRGTVTPQPDSSLRYRGAGSFTGGTGGLDGAKGRFTLTGTQQGGSPKASFRLRGALDY